MLLAIGDAFADSTDHVTGLANTNADLAFLVADDNDGPEAHLLTAFDGLGDAADLNHALLPFGVALLAATTTTPIATTTVTVAMYVSVALSENAGSLKKRWATDADVKPARENDQT